VVALQVRRGGQAGGVEGARHLVGICAVELDLDAEGLVGVTDHVLPLVLSAGSQCELEQLPVQIVVGYQRPLAFGHLGALGSEEVVPQPLGPGLLAVDALALVAVALDGPRVDISPLGRADGWILDLRHEGGGRDRDRAGLRRGTSGADCVWRP